MANNQDKQIDDNTGWILNEGMNENEQLQQLVKDLERYTGRKGDLIKIDEKAQKEVLDSTDEWIKAWLERGSLKETSMDTEPFR